MRVLLAGLQARVEATTAADGAFTSPPLPAGGYRVSIGGRFAIEREIGSAQLTPGRDEDLGTLRALR